MEPLLGSVKAEQGLIDLLARQEGYTREIAKFFGADPDSIHKQLVKLEAGGELTSKTVGRTVVYRFKPRYAFLSELEQLLQRALEAYPAEERERLQYFRRRPEGAGSRHEADCRHDPGRIGGLYPDPVVRQRD